MNWKKTNSFLLTRLLKPIKQPLIAVLLGFSLAVAGTLVSHHCGLTPPVFAQSVRPEFVSEVVYQRLPDLPKENQYISIDTGEIAPDNTLITRLVRYHQDVQKRPPQYRLDWKLTLADYLGVNQSIQEERYPGKSTLTVNPMEADIKILRSLNRRQRDELVNVIVSVYSSQSTESNNSPSNNQPSPQPSPSPNNPSLSQPGDADLLKF
jgi:hypothetical protein